MPPKFHSRWFSSAQRARNTLAVSTQSSTVEAGILARSSVLLHDNVSLGPSQQLGRSWGERLSEYNGTSRVPIFDYSPNNRAGIAILQGLILEHGVRHIFGTSSHTILQDLGHQPANKSYNSNQLFTIRAQHDAAAGFMAEGYARATGKPSVTLASSPSEIPSLVTPLQDALCDGVPIVVLYCPKDSTRNGESNSSFDSPDVLGITRSCTKWNARTESIAQLPTTIRDAFKIAMSGRPGPVLIHIPYHILQGIDTQSPPASLEMEYPARRAMVSRLRQQRKLSSQEMSQSQALSRVSQLISNARTPVIYAGAGMLASPHGPTILKAFADKTLIPVTTSLQGLGCFDELDSKALHMLGLHGSGYANMAVQHADLIISLGARFDDRVTGSLSKFAPEAKRAAIEGRGGIVHFEIAPKNANKVVQATEVIVGDCTENLTLLLPKVRRVPKSERMAWMESINDWKERWPLDAWKGYPTNGSPATIKAQAAIKMLNDLTASRKDKTIITTGVGQHQMFAAQQFRWRHARTMITSGGLGTMGYGLPAAIGAKLARPDCLVVDIDGDASFSMSLSELRTIAKHNIGVKILLCNNDEMGMVMDLQRLYYDKRFNNVRQRNPDFVKVAESFDIPAKVCKNKNDLQEMIEWLLQTDGPAILEVKVESNSPVWPVVPAGKGLHEFVTYPESRLHV